MRSIAGLKLTRKCVSNWHSILVVYLRIKSSTIARFEDGKEIVISRTNYDEFQEEVFKRFMQDRGYRYSTRDGKKVAYTPDGLQIMYLIPYSFMLDEVFVTKEYGERNLRGRVVIDAGTYMAETCRKQGASKVSQIRILSYIRGKSTTNIINNIIDAYGEHS
jgi:hypothetical protein